MELRREISRAVYQYIGGIRHSSVCPHWFVESMIDRILVEVEKYAKEKAAGRKDEEGPRQRELPLSKSR